MISVLDSNATYNSDADDEGHNAVGIPGDRSPTKCFVISTNTIVRGSLVREDEDIDETLKAKFLARLFREYRRNLEHANRVARREKR